MPPIPSVKSDLGLKDGISALRQVQEHAAKFGVTAGRIGIGGFSPAGGAVYRVDHTVLIREVREQLMDYSEPTGSFATTNSSVAALSGQSPGSD